MKKLSDFIVEKRYYILSIMLVLCIVCAFFIPHVKINKDLTVYLPDSSPVKEGLEIMNEEFPNSTAMGVIRVMFKDLESGEIQNVADKLKAIRNVTSVDYSEGDAYNKAPYTLFVVHSDYKYDTQEEKTIEKDIAKAFADENVVVQHTDATISEIPLFIYAIVFVVLIVILFVMCSSYVEPLLFLFTIGIAVVMNMGSNIMFDSVSQNTYTLSAILQLALSMDYSIILMNRYRQGKQNAEIPKEAMKNAFVAAFPSIISSGMTTVIGLIMLIFMRFKIGLDLGRVMAKGVALSMICVLTVLPALILIFDKQIEKTKKKSPRLHTKFLANFGFKAKRVLAVVFIFLFIGTFVLQSFTRITFAQPKVNKINDVFPLSNQIVVIYDNEDDEKILSIIPEIEKMDKVNAVIGYGNTLGKQMTADELKKSLAAMGGLNINPEFIDMAYYLYFNPNNLPRITPHDFVSFIDDVLMKDESFEGYFDDEIKAQISKLRLMTDKDFLTAEKTASELSEITGIKEDQISLLIALAYSQNPQYTPSGMTLNEFVNFIENDIVTNPVFKDKLSPADLAKLSAIAPFTDKEIFTKPLPASEIVKFLPGVDINIVNTVFMMKFGSVENKTMSLFDFTDFILTAAQSNPAISSAIPKESIDQLNLLKAVMALSLANTKLSPELISSVTPNISKEYMRIMFAYHDVLTNGNNLTLSVHSLLATAASLTGTDNQMIDFDVQTAKLIQSMYALADASVKETKLTSTMLGEIISPLAEGKITQNQIDLIYLSYGGMNGSDSGYMKISPVQLLSFISGTVMKDERFSHLFDDKTKADIEKANAEISKSVGMIRGKDHSILLIDSDLPEESPETTDFVHSLEKMLNTETENSHYLVGYSAIDVEMEDNFKSDLVLITLLTSIAIFIVVALTFRSISIPLMLVLIVQCGVYIAVSFSGLIGHSLYYLALLVVQCVLMGATIDYAIVFTNYYIDDRKTMGVQEALISTFEKSIHTILTSGLIIFFITGIIGISPADPAITQICMTLAVGTGSVIMLILFVLPGLIACFDRFITKDKRKRKLKTAKPDGSEGGETKLDASEDEEQKLDNQDTSDTGEQKT